MCESRADFILHGDVYAGLDWITQPIAVAITSPPYWKQRDYGYPGQLGLEDTSEEYLGRLVAIFRKLKDTLRSDGVFFLNIGDKYLRQYGKSHLLQIPYRLAYHMVQSGWRLEDIIVWYKPNHLPSPVNDRFSNTYEPILVFTKNEQNMYRKNLPPVIRIPLQPTPWKHTAVFPESLISELLTRVNLVDDAWVLDPFGGTGTVSYVVKQMRNRGFPRIIRSIIIEKGCHFVDIIHQRVRPRTTIRLKDLEYIWNAVSENGLNPDVSPNEITENRYGEVFIAEHSDEFLQGLQGITTPHFQRYHREDALYFFGVINWTLEDLYYSSQIFPTGYVLRNMLVHAQESTWYPIFMFARDSTRVAYRFHLDRVRIGARIAENRDWFHVNFLEMTVRDITGKKTIEGQVAKVVEQFEDGFPKIVVVQWNGSASMESVLHPNNDELIMNGIVFSCPRCQTILKEPYDLLQGTDCPTCGRALWVDFQSIPLICEPKDARQILDLRTSKHHSLRGAVEIPPIEVKTSKKSKFSELPRVNWGASPGARTLMLGDSFTKTRLYRVDQPVVAQYLALLRRSKDLSLKAICEMLPKEYRHTVGHWFRKDFGGSTPIPNDIPLLKSIFTEHDSLLNILERTALKFQTVKTAIKGKNPGDFLTQKTKTALIRYLQQLYLPSSEYITNKI
jgi:site-specific DNA-methyltransferase (adenine-specific)